MTATIRCLADKLLGTVTLVVQQLTDHFGGCGIDSISYCTNRVCYSCRLDLGRINTARESRPRMATANYCEPPVPTCFQVPVRPHVRDVHQAIQQALCHKECTRFPRNTYAQEPSQWIARQVPVGAEFLALMFRVGVVRLYLRCCVDRRPSCGGIVVYGASDGRVRQSQNCS